MAEIVRTPQQQRSIDKKNRIIEAGYKLFAEKGYYSTNTAEIAKEAGVSTGIVYGYFHDKRDILVDVLDVYTERVIEPVMRIFDGLTSPIDFDFLVNRAIDCVLNIHKNNAAIHEALHALTHTDEAVQMKFLAIEDGLTKEIAEHLSACGCPINGLTEKVHLALQIVQTYAHECVFDKHDYIDYVVLRAHVVNILKDLFTE